MAQLNDLLVTGDVKVLNDIDCSGNINSEGTIKVKEIVIPVNPSVTPTTNGAIWIETT